MSEMNMAHSVTATPLTGPVLFGNRTIALLILFLQGFVTPVATAQTINDAPSWLPAATPLYVEIPDVIALKNSWLKTVFYRTYQASAMEPFWKELHTHRGGILPSERLGVSWAQLEETARNGAIFCHWPTKESGLHSLLVAIATDPQAAQQALESCVKSLQQQGDTVANSTMNGINVRVVQIKTASLKENSSSTEAGSNQSRYFFTIKNCLVVCDHAAVASGFIQRTNSSSAEDTLANHETFRKIVPASDAQSGSAGVLRWYIDPWSLWQSTLSPGRREDRAELRRIRSLKRQGFDAISGIGGTARFDLDNSDLVYETKVILTAELKKGSRLLAFGYGQDWAVPGWVPNSVSETFVTVVDPQNLVNAFGSVYDEVYAENYEGAFDELIDSIETEQDGPQALVRQDFFNRIQPLFIQLTDYHGTKSTESPTGKRQLLASATNDPEKTATAIKRFYTGEEGVRFEQKNDVWIWESQNPDQPLFDLKMTGLSWFHVYVIAVAKQHVFIASERSMLDPILRSSEQAKPTTLLPAVSGTKDSDQVGYVLNRDLDAEMRSEMELARLDRLREAGAWEAAVAYWILFDGPELSRTGRSVNVETIPPFDELKETWGREIQQLKFIPEGWLIHGQFLKRGVTP